MDLKYLKGYHENILKQVIELINDNKLNKYLIKKYPKTHDINNDKKLYRLGIDIKNQFLKNEKALDKIIYDSKIEFVNQALGLHSYINRVHGKKIKSINEIRISNRFKRAPIEFLRNILIHELAHLKIKDHNKAFYKLCINMEPKYGEIELDIRIFLTYMDIKGENPWKIKSKD